MIRSDTATCRNPFRAANLWPGVIPYLFYDTTTIAELVERFDSLGKYAEIVGAHGTGKSTLVQMLCNAWTARGINVVNCSLRNKQRQLALKPSQWQQSNCILVIDGAEQLRMPTRWLWRARCKRHNCGLLLTTHKSLGAPELWKTTSQPALIAEIVETLLGQENSNLKFDNSELTNILARNQGNVRETLFELFDVWRVNIECSQPAKT